MHFTNLNPDRASKMQISGMQPLRNNAGIVWEIILFQSLTARPDTALSSPIEITRPTAHIFILFHGLMMKSLNPGWRIDLFLSIWGTEGHEKPQIRDFFIFIRIVRLRQSVQACIGSDKVW